MASPRTVVRRRRSGVTVLLLTAALATSLTTTAPAVGARAGGVVPAAQPADPAVPAAIGDPGSYEIRANVSTANADRLAAEIGAPNRRRMDSILAGADRSMAALSCQTGPERALTPLTEAATGEFGFCWSAGDPDTGAWMPQGITSTADADAGNTYDGVEAIAVTWYGGDDHSVRLSLAPAGGDGTGNDRYRQVLLVNPDDSGGFSAVRDCHAGGAVWYGRLLYVSCTDHMRIFGWEYLYNADTSDYCSNRIGRFETAEADTVRFCAEGHANVMMQIGTVSGTDNFKISTISLDRALTPHKLVVAEYSTDPGAKILRFDLDAATLLPARAAAVDGWTVPWLRVQGATTRGPRLWTHSSGGILEDGEVVSDNYGRLRFWDSTNPGRLEVHVGAYGAEAVSYWDAGDGEGGRPDLLYTLSEHPGYRGVVALRQADFN